MTLRDFKRTTSVKKCHLEFSGSKIDLGKTGTTRRTVSAIFPRKEVIQPHLPVRLPCYDFVPVASPTFDGCLLAVGPPASGVTNSHDVTGGVYKAREHIHRSVLTCGY
jgi:hypothetical protein